MEFVDQGDEVALSEALESAPWLLLIETSSNPLMRVVDIARLAKKARKVFESFLGKKAVGERLPLVVKRLQDRN